MPDLESEHEIAVIRAPIEGASDGINGEPRSMLGDEIVPIQFIRVERGNQHHLVQVRRHHLLLRSGSGSTA